LSYTLSCTGILKPLTVVIQKEIVSAMSQTQTKIRGDQPERGQ